MNHHSKSSRIIFWVATTIIILFEGVMPLSTVIFSPENVNAGTKALGYPDYFAYALILCKVLGVIAISVPHIPGKLKEWAYAGFTFNLVFAFISHAYVDKNIGYMLLPLIILAILALSYIYNPQIKKYSAS